MFSVSSNLTFGTDPKLEKMTTRECYFKAYCETDMPYILFFYSTIKENNINAGEYTNIRFNIGHEENITKLEKIAQNKDFYMWCNDTEFIKLLKGIKFRTKILGN